MHMFLIQIQTNDLAPDLRKRRLQGLSKHAQMFSEMTVQDEKATRWKNNLVPSADF